MLNQGSRVAGRCTGKQIAVHLFMILFSVFCKSVGSPLPEGAEVYLVPTLRLMSQRYPFSILFQVAFICVSTSSFKKLFFTCFWTCTLLGFSRLRFWYKILRSKKVSNNLGRWLFTKIHITPCLEDAADC